MKTINLEEIILNEYGCHDIEDLHKSFDVSISMIKNIAKESIRQALELAVENAETEYEFDNVIVDNQSILSVIGLVE